ncbi:MAG: RNA polymerase sigma factor [Sandaracinaceae bacterium]
MTTSLALHPLARSPLDDQAVVDHVLAGDLAAFEILMRRYNQRVYRAARAVLRDDAEAQDAAQQAWLAAYRHLGTWARRSAFPTWLLRIAVREAGRRRRAPHRARLRLVESPQGEANVSSPEAEAARAHLRAILEDAIDALPATLRTVLVLRDVEELSGPETAEALGLSDAAVRVRLHRARRALRERLETILTDRIGEAYPFLGERCDQIVARVLRAVREGSGGDPS